MTKYEDQVQRFMPEVLWLAHIDIICGIVMTGPPRAMNRFKNLLYIIGFENVCTSNPKGYHSTPPKYVTKITLYSNL
jgi:hypothetical protein